MPRASHAAADAADAAVVALYELNLGATAVGTGLNAGDDYTALAVDRARAADEAAAASCGQPLSRHAEHG